MNEIEMPTAEAVSAEVVEATPVEVPNLFRTNEPAEVLIRAQETADTLMPKVRDKGLVVRFGDKEYLTLEAWQTLGTMLGVTVYTVETKPIDKGWEARAEVRTLDGRTIGAAESMCQRTEENWRTSDEFAIRSMAQTRAQSKALASVLRFVATLGGVAGTPAEEMDGVRSGGSALRSGPHKPSDKQLGFLDGLLKGAGVSFENRQTIRLYAEAELSGGKGGKCSEAIDWMKKRPAETAERLVTAAEQWADAQPRVPPEYTDTEDLPEVNADGEIIGEAEEDLPF